MKPIMYLGILLLGAWWGTSANAETFGGYECTDDCSGHKAGYEWAEQNGVSNENDCDGNSGSFEEGCRAFIEDPNRGSDEDDDGNEIDE